MLSPLQILRRIRRVPPLDAEKHWAERVAKFRAENSARPTQDTKCWVLLGDSLSEDFPAWLLRSLGGPWLNRGIAGDHLCREQGGGLCARLDPGALAAGAARIYLLAGINDLGDHPHRPDLVLERYETLLSQLRQLYPDAQVICQALLPVRGNYAHLAPGIRAINAALVPLSAAHGARHLDLHRCFVDQHGLLAAMFSRDGLHLNRLGYLRWALALRKS